METKNKNVSNQKICAGGSEGGGVKKGQQGSMKKYERERGRIGKINYCLFAPPQVLKWNSPWISSYYNLSLHGINFVCSKSTR